MFSKTKLSARDKMEKAYFELLETTHYSKITVADIIEKAGVSRTTFYRHYMDIFDMHEKVADRLSSVLISTCIKKVLVEGGDDAYLKITEVLCSQDKYIGLISGKNGSRYLFENIYSRVTKYIAPLIKVLPEETVFRLKFITIATIAMYVKDILEGREHNLEFIEICKKIVNLDTIRRDLFGK